MRTSEMRFAIAYANFTG